MTKKAKTFMFICFGGVEAFLFRGVINAAMDGMRAPLLDYFGLLYMTPWGVLLLLSCFGLIGLLVSHLIKRRGTKGKKPISAGYKVSFILSFVPYVLFLAYCVLCSKFGFDFFTTTYGWEGFRNAFIVVGFVYCVIPVFPFCLFWQILYIVKWIRNRKASA